MISLIRVFQLVNETFTIQIFNYLISCYNHKECQPQKNNYVWASIILKLHRGGFVDLLVCF